MCETSNWISASWLRGHLGHSQRAVKRRWSTARGKLALVKRASITKKRRVFGKKRKYHVICGSPFGVVEAAVGSWIRCGVSICRCMVYYLTMVRGKGCLFLYCIISIIYVLPTTWWVLFVPPMLRIPLAPEELR